jgi:hypothetical protein
MASDLLTYSLSSLDESLLDQVHKKGFAEFIKGADDPTVWEYAKLYPIWHELKLGKCPVFLTSDPSYQYPQDGKKHGREDFKLVVYTPKLRSHRKTYYAWIKELELPKSRWFLLTLTLYRSVGFVNAWKNINFWVSAFLHRFRNWLRRRYGYQLVYLWVIENHKDGFPHVHVLLSFPFLPDITLPQLLELFHSWWVSEDGSRLSAFQGIDLKYVRGGVQEVKAYVLKYLVKSHSKYWGYTRKGDFVSVRASTLLMWVFRVKLFGMSRDLRAPMRKSSVLLVWAGSTTAYRVYKAFYEDLKISYEEWLPTFLDMVYIVRGAAWLDYLTKYGSLDGW